ncbi:MAG: hypothetical protein Q9211_001414 [Gyalolechia sp. 1 TL-2023]
MWALTAAFTLFPCLLLIAPAFSSPISILDQLDARALNASDAGFLKDHLGRPPFRPSIPYSFLISPEPLYLKLTRYGNPIDTDVGVRFSYVSNPSRQPSLQTATPPQHTKNSRKTYFLTVSTYPNHRSDVLQRLNIFIREEGREREIMGLVPVTVDRLALRLYSLAALRESCAIQVGDLHTWVRGMKAFMRLYGWLEVDMQILGIPPARQGDDAPLCDRATLRLADPDRDVQEQ